MEYAERFVYTIQSHQCGGDKRLKPHVFFNMLEDAAWRNAETLGFGYASMAAEGRFWAISRITLAVDRYPLWGEEAMVETWPKRLSGPFALRDFLVRANGGAVVMRSASAWIMVDAATGRAVRPQGAFLTSLARYTGAPDALAEPPGKVRGATASTPGAAFDAPHSAEDVNGHVNNGEFVRWAHDVVQADFRPPGTKAGAAGPCRIDAEFRAEVKRGEALAIHGAASSAGEEPPWSLAEGKLEDGRAAFAVRFTWPPAESA